jgi:hypothetical protein
MPAPYNFNAVEYPSVTGILKLLDKSEALIPWGIEASHKALRAKMNGKRSFTRDEIEQMLTDSKYAYQEVSETALDVGSEVHDAIEKYIRFGADKVGTVRDQVGAALIAFWDWEKAHKVKWIASEMPVVHAAVGYAGTLDAIAEVDGVITCIDFKNAKAVYPEYFDQVIAYKFAREWMNDKKFLIEGPQGQYERTYDKIAIERVAILRLDKETGIPDWQPFEKPQTEVDRRFKAFCHLVDFYYANKIRRLKNNPKVEVWKKKKLKAA